MPLCVHQSLLFNTAKVIYNLLHTCSYVGNTLHSEEGHLYALCRRVLTTIDDDELNKKAFSQNIILSW